MNILVRDTNGNTLDRAWAHIIPKEFSLDEAHMSDSGTLIVTLELPVEYGDEEEWC